MTNIGYLGFTVQNTACKQCILTTLYLYVFTQNYLIKNVRLETESFKSESSHDRCVYLLQARLILALIKLTYI